MGVQYLVDLVTNQGAPLEVLLHHGILLFCLQIRQLRLEIVLIDDHHGGWKRAHRPLATQERGFTAACYFFGISDTLAFR